MKDVWEFDEGPIFFESGTTPKREKTYGKHPTQKPIALLERLILAATKEGDLVLDPFNGSGTTGIVATKLQRGYIGMDKEMDFLELTKKRYLGG
jgi:site-specific DNA-methyltransferase (adenine-specific)